MVIGSSRRHVAPIPADYLLVSKRQRSHPLPETADVVILGDSVTACALVAEAARLGIKTVLLATTDFGAGEGIGLPLVAGGRGLGGGMDLLQAAGRRATLAVATRRWRDLLEPLRVMAPVEDSRAAGAALRIGLAIGEALRPRNGVPRHQRLRPRQVHGVAPFLPGGRVAAITFPDARIRAPHRLAVELALESERNGAHTSNGVTVTGIEILDGAVSGVRVRRGTRTRTIRTARVITADLDAERAVLALTGAEREPRARASFAFGAFELTGAVPRDAAVNRDGPRLFFAVPAHHLLLAGPVEDQGAGIESITSSLVEQLAGLVPGLGIREEHLRYIYHGSIEAGRASIREQPGLRGLFTAAATFDELPRLASQLHGVLAPTRPSIRPPSDPGEAPPDFGKLDRVTRAHLRQYRNGLAEILAGDRTVICPHSGAIAAEISYVALHERPRSLADILLRRTGIAWAPCRATCCDARAAAIAGEALGWSPAETERQFHEARAEIDTELPALRQAGPAETPQAA